MKTANVKKWAALSWSDNEMDFWKIPSLRPTRWCEAQLAWLFIWAFMPSNTLEVKFHTEIDEVTARQNQQNKKNKLNIECIFSDKSIPAQFVSFK